MSKHKLFTSNSFGSPALSSPSSGTPIKNARVSMSSGTITLGNRDEQRQDCQSPNNRSNQGHSANMPETPDKDLDSDLMEVDFFSKFNHKLPYTIEEDEFILRHVLKGQNIFKVSSILLWKHLEFLKKNPKRTYQSLKNRFLKNIKPVIFTKYRYLIRNKETTNMILTKFPELKKQMRIGETLSRIKIPVRKQSGKFEEAATPSATPVTRRNHPQAPDPVSSSPGFRQSPQLTRPPRAAASTSISPKIMNFYRKVELANNSIKVLVNLNHRNSKLDKSTVPLLLNERFKKSKVNAGPFVCPVCGQISLPSKVDETSGSETDGENVIPNSIETARGSQKKKSLSCRLRRRKKINAKSDTGSQSLLTFQDNKDEDTGKSLGTIHMNGRRSQRSDLGESRKDVGGNSQNEISKASSLNQESNSGLEKDQNSDIDMIYENAMANFQKLISADEEKQLMKKCLYKNRDMIGFDFDSEKNLDSYFLESSPDEKTPSLTNSYPTASSTNEDTAERESQKKDDSPLTCSLGTIMTRERSKKMKS